VTPAKFVGTASLIAVAACSKSSPSAHSTTPGAGAATSTPTLTGYSGSAVVTMTPRVRIMEQQDGLAALRGMSTSGMALVFDAANPIAARLTAGDVLMIKGTLARTVLGVDRRGTELLVLTQPAAITDVVRDGTLNVHAPVHFAAGGGAWVMPPGAWRVVPVNDLAVALGDSGGSGHRFHGTLDDWDVDFGATPGGGKLGLSLTMSRTFNGVAAQISVDGYLQDFDLLTNISISGSSLSELSGAFKNLNGAFTMKWALGKDTPGKSDTVSEIALPGVWKVSLAPLLDGLPLSLEVSGALIVHQLFSGGKQFTSGTYRITYDGYQHFVVRPSNATSDGQVSGDLDFQPQPGISAVAPFGMIVAFGAPRIQLVFGGPAVFPMQGVSEAASTVDLWADRAAQALLSQDGYQKFKESGLSLTKAVSAAQNTGAVVYARVVSTSATTYTGMSVITPCSRTNLEFDLSVGASAQAFGVSSGPWSKKALDKSFVKIVPEGTKLCEKVTPQ
jgi:hypothetical protein